MRRPRRLKGRLALLHAAVGLQQGCTAGIYRETYRNVVFTCACLCSVLTFGHRCPTGMMYETGPLHGDPRRLQLLVVWYDVPLPVCETRACMARPGLPPTCCSSSTASSRLASTSCRAACVASSAPFRSAQRFCSSAIWRSRDVTCAWIKAGFGVQQHGWKGRVRRFKRVRNAVTAQAQRWVSEGWWVAVLPRWRARVGMTAAERER